MIGEIVIVNGEIVKKLRKNNIMWPFDKKKIEEPVVHKLEKKKDYTVSYLVTWKYEDINGITPIDVNYMQGYDLLSALGKMMYVRKHLWSELLKEMVIENYDGNLKILSINRI